MEPWERNMLMKVRSAYADAFEVQRAEGIREAIQQKNEEKGERENKEEGGEKEESAFNQNTAHTESTP